MGKIALKGASNLHFAPVTTNTEAAYVAGDSQAIPTLQELSKTDNREDFEILADDGIYDSGSDFQSTDMDITVAELPPAIEALLSGATFDDVSGVLTAKSTDVAPEIAVGYAALQVSGGYRLFKHHVCKLMSVSPTSHQTKQGNTIAAYNIRVRSVARKIDSAYREQKDVAKGDSIDWVKDFTTLP